MRFLTLGLLKCIQCASNSLCLKLRGKEKEFRSKDVSDIPVTGALEEIQEGIVVCESCFFYYTIGVQGLGILDASPAHFRDPLKEKEVLEGWGFDTSKLRLKIPRLNAREKWLLTQFKEAMKAYENPGECWSIDELEMMPYFLRILKKGGVVLDLAGGYGRCVPSLLERAGFIVLGDLSSKELNVGKELLKDLRRVDFVRLNMLNPPFKEKVFDGIWFTQAFEYVPPDKLEKFIENISRILKPGGVFFGNIERQPLWRLLKAYLSLRLKGNPAKLGEYHYKLKDGLLHYHSVPTLTRSRIERLFEKYDLVTVCKQDYHKEGSYPLVYLLQRQEEIVSCKSSTNWRNSGLTNRSQEN